MRIPAGEGFGNAVPEAERAANLNPGAYGVGMTEGVQQAVGRELYERRQELRRAELQAQHEAEQARKAADRAKALGAMTKAQDDLVALSDEIGEGIRTGEIDKREAEQTWATRAQERVTAAMADVPADHAELTRIDLDSRVSGLTRTVRKSVLQRDQQDVRTGIDQTMESAQRLYLTDPKRADALVAATIEQQGPHSGLAPDALQKLQQGYRESTRWNKAQTLITAARRDNKALSKVEDVLAGDEFAELDPGRRATLMGQIEGYRVQNEQRAEIAARRAEAAADRHLRRAEAAYTAATGLVSSGKVLSDAYIQELTTATAGTPFAKALPELVRQAPERSAFGMQPLATQDATIRQMRATLNQQGTDPKTEKRLAELEQIRDQAVAEIKSDPFKAAADRGVIDGVPPLRMDLQTLPAQISQRLDKTETVRQWAGQDVSPFLPDEAKQFGDALQKMPPAEKSQALNAVSTVLNPSQRRALAAQLESGGNRSLGLSMRYTGATTTQGRLVSELILRGAQAKQDGTSTKGDKQPEVKANTWKAYAAQQFSGVFPNQQDANDMRDAADLVMHGMAAEEGGRLSGDDMDRAIRMAVGGTIVERNGRKIPLPAGMTDGQLDERLRTVAPRAVAAQAKDGKVRAAGVEMSADEFSKTLPGQQLMPIRPGVFTVLVGGRPVTTTGGKPIEIGVR